MRKIIMKKNTLTKVLLAVSAIGVLGMTGCSGNNRQTQGATLPRHRKKPGLKKKSGRRKRARRRRRHRRMTFWRQSRIKARL